MVPNQTYEVWMVGTKLRLNCKTKFSFSFMQYMFHLLLYASTIIKSVSVVSTDVTSTGEFPIRTSTYSRVREREYLLGTHITL